MQDADVVSPSSAVSLVATTRKLPRPGRLVIRAAIGKGSRSCSPQRAPGRLDNTCVIRRPSLWVHQEHLARHVDCPRARKGRPPPVDETAVPLPLRRYQLDSRSSHEAATIFRSITPGGLLQTGLHQPRDRPTIAWLLRAAGGNAELVQVADAKARLSSGACRAGPNTGAVVASMPRMGRESCVRH